MATGIAGVKRPSTLGLRRSWPSLPGMLDCWVFSDVTQLVAIGEAKAGSAFNLVYPGAVPTNNWGQVGVTRWGTGGQANSSGSLYFLLPVHSFQGDINVPWTMRLVGVGPASWPGAFSSVATGSTGSARPLQLYVDTSGVYSFGTVGGATPPSFTLPAGALFDLVVTGAAGGGANSATFYLNGLSLGTGTWTASAATTIELGSTGGAGSAAGIVYFLYQQWARALPAAEVYTCFSDLWGFLEPLPMPQRKWVNAAGTPAFSTYFDMTQPDRATLLRRPEMQAY